MATKLGRFNNPVSGSILAVILVMIFAGVLLLIAGNWYGIPTAVLAVLLYFVGETELPENPVTAGVLYFWGRPILRNEKALIVAGTTLSLDFFPVKLKLFKIDMSSKNFDYSTSVTTSEGITIPVKVVIVGKANAQKSIDLIQVGGTLEKAFDLIKGILGVSLQILVEGKSLDDLTENGELVRALGDKLIQMIEGGSFGVTVDKLSLDFDQPEDIRVAALQQIVESYQQVAEERDLRTALGQAKMIRDAISQDPGIERHLDRVIGVLRASRAGGVQAIVGGNGGGKKNRRSGDPQVVAVVNPTTKP